MWRRKDHSCFPFLPYRAVGKRALPERWRRVAFPQASPLPFALWHAGLRLLASLRSNYAERSFRRRSPRNRTLRRTNVRKTMNCTVKAAILAPIAPAEIHHAQTSMLYDVAI